MGHYHGINLFLVDRLLIPASIKPTGIDFTGNLLDLHAVARIGQEIYDGLFYLHSLPVVTVIIVVSVVVFLLPEQVILDPFRVGFVVLSHMVAQQACAQH